MKKNFLTIVAIACMAFAAPVYAQQGGKQIDLQVSIDSPTTPKGGIRKAPPRIPSIQMPSVFLDGNTLYFDTPCDGCTLQLVDEEDFVVYSVTIPEGTTEWELPDSLFGEYKLQIIRGKYCFYGWIELYD